MEIYAGCKIFNPGVVPEVRARRTCSLLPRRTRFFSRVYTSLTCAAVLIGFSSASTPNAAVVSDHGYPPYFLGEQPQTPDMEHLRVSLVPRKKSVYEVMYEPDTIDEKHVQQKEPAAAPRLPRLAATLRRPTGAATVKKPEGEGTKKGTQGKGTRTLKETKKAKAKVKKANHLKHGAGDNVILAHGVAGALVVLLCLLAIRPATWYLFADFAISNAAAAFAYSRLSRWYKSRQKGTSESV